MNITKALENLKKAMGEDPLCQEMLAAIETEANLLLKEKAEAESKAASSLQRLRHDISQPLTVLQSYLDLVPFEVDIEKRDSSNLVNPEFWQGDYQRAIEALKEIVKIVQSASK